MKADRPTALTVAIFVLLAAGALAFQTYGLPDTWCADEISALVKNMVERRSFDPTRFMYPSFMADLCYALARLVGAESALAIGHVCRTVSALAFLGTVLCMGRTVEKVVGRALPFAYFFAGANLALVHHAHIATVNSVFFFTIALALLQFVRTVLSRKESDFYLSVAACSLACGAKYNGLFLFGVLPVVFLVTFDLEKTRFLRMLVVSLLLAPLPFLATTPYCLLNYPAFNKDWVALTEVEGPAFRWHVGTIDFFKNFLGLNVAFFTPIGAGLVAAWLLARWRSLAKTPATLVLLATFFMYLLETWKIGILQPRYYLPASLVLAELFLVALFTSPWRRRRAATIAVLVFFGLANLWVNVAAFALSAKARTLPFLEPLEGRIGVVAYVNRRPFQPGPLDARCDTFMVDLADQDVATFDEYLGVIERFFAEKKPRFVVFEGVVVEWAVFRPRSEAQDYGARLKYPNPGLPAWEEHLARAGYRPLRTIESCEGPLAMRWLLGGYYLWTAEGVGRRVHVYERRAE
jgi:hypothetical protein